MHMCMCMCMHPTNVRSYTVTLLPYNLAESYHALPRVYRAVQLYL